MSAAARRRFLALALCAPLAATGAGAGVFLMMTVKRDGATVSSPRLYIGPGEESIVQAGPRLRLHVAPVAAGSAASLRFKVLATPEDGEPVELAQPELAVTPNVESSFTVRADDGSVYRVGFIAFPTRQP